MQAGIGAGRPYKATRAERRRIQTPEGSLGLEYASRKERIRALYPSPSSEVLHLLHWFRQLFLFLNPVTTAFLCAIYCFSPVLLPLIAHRLSNRHLVNADSLATAQGFCACSQVLQHSVGIDHGFD